MKTKLYLIIAIVCAVLAPLVPIQANDDHDKGTITGVVLDAETKEPLIGATVIIKGTSIGAITDFDGRFIINKVSTGAVSLQVSYISYQPKIDEVLVKKGKAVNLVFELKAENFQLQEVSVVVKANKEGEKLLLAKRKNSLLATQTVGAVELSRKGIGDAQSAMAKVSGVTKQEGVKNVFVRGLGDRYNMTTLNGFTIPSEDPEYKNISLGFFSTDIIQNIGVNKVFSADLNGDVGGAVVDISSKELTKKSAFSTSLSTGVNTGVLGSSFLVQDGVNYFGVARKAHPSDDLNRFDFVNKLDPKQAKHTIDNSFLISGGKQFKIGESSQPISTFFVLSNSTDFAYKKALVQDVTSDGTLTKDQTGERFQKSNSQLALANLSHRLFNKHQIDYNFLMIHATEQDLGYYTGFDAEKYAEYNHIQRGITIRQQANENLLLTNQLRTNLEFNKKLNLDLGAALNIIRGFEPDRRENSFTQTDKPNEYLITGSSSQRRFFSELSGRDLNTKAKLNYKLKDKFDTKNSNISIGYDMRLIQDEFNAIEFPYDAPTGSYSKEKLKLDEFFNQDKMDQGSFERGYPTENIYKVNKMIHSAFASGSYQIQKDLTLNLGLRYDHLGMLVYFKTDGAGEGLVDTQRNFFLPSLNLKYNLNKKNALRLGLSKTYTLPQSKELAPYQYVNISYASQGNQNLKPSENYNLDLKWDYYLSAGELLSVNLFYKRIMNPIGRVDQGNSAGLLTYENISDYAEVAGLEFELKKDLLNLSSSESERTNKLSLGANLSYIFTQLNFQAMNTPMRKEQLEGAAPLIANLDLSYVYKIKGRGLQTSLVFNYVSDKVHTLGTQGYHNIIEQSIAGMDFVCSYSLNKHFSIKAKAGNLLNQPFRLYRAVSDNGQKVTLNQYQKGINLSLGVSYKL